MNLFGPLLGSPPRSARSVAPEEQGSGDGQPIADLSLRIARLEEECANYKAGYDQIKGLVDRLEALEARGAEQEKKLATAAKVGGQDECAPMVPRADSDYLNDQFNLYETPLAESIYTDFVVTCARGSAYKVITSTLLCLFCVAVQLLFIDMIANFSERDVIEQAESAGIWGRQWDKIQEHNTSSFFTQDEYCNGSAWSWEANTIESYHKYLRPHWISHRYFKLLGDYLSRGKLLCSLALLLWCIHCVSELRDVVDFVSILSLPCHSDHESAYHFDNSEKKGTLHRLGWQSRIAVIVIAICRLMIITSLCYYGCVFLVYTISLVDFILNALALSFVVDIDDICFRFLSPDKQRAVRSLSPPVMDGCTAKAFHCFSPVAELVSIALTFTVLIWAQTPMRRVEDAIVENSLELCDWKWLGKLEVEIMQTLDI